MNTCTHSDISLTAGAICAEDGFKASPESSLQTIETTPQRADEIFFRIDALLRDLRLCFLQLNMAVHNVTSAAHMVKNSVSENQPTPDQKP